MTISPDAQVDSPRSWFNKPVEDVVAANPQTFFQMYWMGTRDDMRARMERCFRIHPNRRNPFAHALLAGELMAEPAPREARRIELVAADAATYLEQAPPQSFRGFTLSNILDGASAAYRARLFRAIRHAAAPDAVVVLRSFAEPAGELRSNVAADDSSMLWGIVDVRPATALEA